MLGLVRSVLSLAQSVLKRPSGLSLDHIYRFEDTEDAPPLGAADALVTGKQHPDRQSNQHNHPLKKFPFPG